MRTFDTEKPEVTDRELRKLRNEEFHNFCSLNNVDVAITSRKMRKARHETCKKWTQA
jgi:DeoR/GlpR family transcriptional regulator of sugar metabolism